VILSKERRYRGYHHDTYNIAWKLEAVLRHGAGDSLLDTYDAERRPVAEHTMSQALTRLQAWFKDPSKKLPPAEPIIDDYAVMFGYRYRTGAFVDDDENSSERAFDDPRAPFLSVLSFGTRVENRDR